MRRWRRRAGQTGRYGAAGEPAAWRAVYKDYYWDRLEQAFAGAKELGAGSRGHGLVGYRTIEGETMTRVNGEINDVNEWLKIEVIPGEMVEPLERLTERVIEGCDAVATRMGFEHGPETLLTVMAAEANVPWMPGRQGYCVDKYPYDKICIPHSSLRDHDDLQHVVHHEYAHVVNLNLSQGRCPLWLDEAVAMAIGGGADRRAWSALAKGSAQWLDPEVLDASFGRNREDEREWRIVWLGYQQSAVIGTYLAQEHGTRGLGRLMRGFANNSFLRDLLLSAKGLGQVDEALNEVYGFNTRTLFERSFEWLRAGSGS
ncbi:MAG TPA: hypothetical protein VNI20_02690 [Fimbriimonadaceae bacterium]|nr:hypothetical protein [Fimbriimonadaceae bacterium]